MDINILIGLGILAIVIIVGIVIKITSKNKALPQPTDKSLPETTSEEEASSALSLEATTDNTQVAYSGEDPDSEKPQQTANAIVEKEITIENKPEAQPQNEEITAEASIAPTVNDEATATINVDTNTATDSANESITVDSTLPPSPVPANDSNEPTAEQRESMRRGLAKTHSGFMAKLNSLIFGKKGLDDDLIEEMEAILYSSDIGVRTVSNLLDNLKERYSKTNSADLPAVRDSLKNEIVELLKPTINGPKSLAKPDKQPIVYMFVGVNGVGKTTTIGKIAHQLISEGHSVLLAAGDTFRAAAADQLEIWAQRNNCPIYRGQERQDPASVVFEAVKKAANEHIDYVLVDTAGRLHTQANLMEELKKVHRVLGKARSEAPDEVLLVVDATTGQNAIMQAKEFNNIVGLTGIILTKLDGTSKGGVIIGINAELQIPVRYVGVGEQIADLQPFNATAFVDALFE